MNNIITKITGYLFLIFILFSSLFFIFDSLNSYTKVTMKVKQTQNQPISIFYTVNDSDIRELNITQTLTMSDDYQKIKFKIPEKYVYSIDVQFNSLEQEINSVDIESISISSLFNKKNLKSFNNTHIAVDNLSIRKTVASDYIFSKFNVTTKITIIGLCIALLLIFIFRNKINRLLYTNNNLKIVVFTCIIGMFPILQIITLDSNFSSIKQGVLAEKPSLTSYESVVDKSYMDSVEGYLKDQMPYRDSFIEDYYAYNRLLQRKQFGSSYVSSDNILLPSGYNESIITNNANKIIQLNNYFSDNDIPFYTFVAPTKGSLYSHEFPSYIDEDSEQTREKFLGLLDENNVKNEDLQDFVYDEVYLKGEQTHFRTDHHWTIETAFKAYQHILSRFDEEDIPYEHYSSDNFDSLEFKDSFIGSDGRAVAYGNRYFQNADDFTLIYPSGETNYSLYDLDGTEIRSGDFLQIVDGYYLSDLDPYTNRYGVYNELPNKVLTNNNIDTDSTILVIGDSYSLPVSNFLSTNFKNVILLDQRTEEKGATFNYIKEHSDTIDVVLNLQYIPTIQRTEFYDFFQ